MVVSHDRDFLNTVTSDIIHLHDLQLHAYRGNFAQFEEMYEQRRREANKVADKFEKQMKVAKKTGSKASQDKANFLFFALYSIFAAVQTAWHFKSSQSDSSVAMSWEEILHPFQPG